MTAADAITLLEIPSHGLTRIQSNEIAARIRKLEDACRTAYEDTKPIFDDALPQRPTMMTLLLLKAAIE